MPSRPESSQTPRQRRWPLISLVIFGVLVATGIGIAYRVVHPKLQDYVFFGTIVGFLSLLQLVLLLNLAGAAILTLLIVSDRLRQTPWGPSFSRFVGFRFLRSSRASVKTTGSGKRLSWLTLSLALGWGTSFFVIYAKDLPQKLVPIVTLPIVFTICLALTLYHLRWLFRVFNLNSVVSIFGVGLGVWALIIVLSVMGGFANDIRSKILRTNEHVRVQTEPLEKGTRRYFELADRVRQLPDVIEVSPFIRYDVMIASNLNLSYVSVKGIDPQRADVMNHLGRDIIEGDLRFLRYPEEILSDRGLFPNADSRYFKRRFRRPGERLNRDEKERKQLLEKLRKRPIEPTVKKPPRTEPSTPKSPTNRPTPKSPTNRPTPLGPTTSKPATSKPTVRTEDTDRRVELETRPPLKPDPAFDIDPFFTERVYPGILIGRELATSLQVTVGSEIELISPEGAAGPVLAPRNWRYRIAGIFFTGSFEYDLKLVYLALPEAQRFFSFNADVQGVEVKVRHPLETQRFERALEAMLKRDKAEFPGLNFTTLDWKKLNRNLFSALKLERIVIFIILGLIVFVASFSIAGTLIMLILEKTSEIATLVSMGASRRSIMAIFSTIGTTIGILGTVCGLISGIGFCLLIQVGVPTPSWLYLDRLPVHMDWSEIVRISLAAVAITAIATIPPAVSASRLDPVEGLRYE